MSSILSKLINLAGNITGTLAVANGGTGVTTSTGSGNVVLSTSPTLVTPVLGTPASGTLTNCTGYPVVVPGTSAGLVSSSGLPGNTTGSAIASGYVGEVVTFTSRTITITNTATWYINTSALATLSAGIWAIYGNIAGGTASYQYLANIGTSTSAHTSSILPLDSAIIMQSTGGGTFPMIVGTYVASGSPAIYGSAYCITNGSTSATMAGIAVRIA